MKNTSIETNGNDLKIIAFTDMHFGGGNPSDRVLKIIRNLVRRHEPDFVVYMGDQSNDAGGIQYLDEITQVMTKYKIPWALVFGNHDRDAGVKNESIKVESFDEYCLYQKGLMESEDHKNYGNYAIDFTDHGKLIYTAVFLDSSPGYIAENQVEWYSTLMIRKAIDTFGQLDLTAGLAVPSFLMMHHGVPEYQMAADNALGAKDSIGPVPSQFGFGEIGRNHHMQREDINYGLFETAKLVGGTHFFCGHDHYNNANMLYEGIQLTYLNKISQNNMETFSEARVSFATQIVLSKQKEGEGDWGLSLSYAMQDGSVTRNHDAWKTLPDLPDQEEEEEEDGGDIKGGGNNDSDNNNNTHTPLSTPTIALIVAFVAAGVAVAAVVIAGVAVGVVVYGRHRIRTGLAMPYKNAEEMAMVQEAM